MVLLLVAAACLVGLVAAVLFAEDVQGGNAAINVPTTAETQIATSNQVTCSNPNGKAVVRCWCELTVGLGTTSVALAVYSGSAIGGSPVYSKQSEAGDFTAGSIAHFELETIQAFANVSYVQYCFSVTQNGATGNGTAQEYLIDTKVLSG